VRFLLDTNVLSEVRRPTPDRNVLQWLDQVDEDRTYISVISLAEISRGIGLMDGGRRKDALAEWLEHDLVDRFAGRVLPVDEKAAFAWGDMMAAARRQGLGLASMDGLLAATALAGELTLVTRNIKDFSSLPIILLDPWTA
jgi:toxin FitB